jgi:alkyl sulfatase BDS1-like metallo-beta-lactamase superfamily hydrolase
LSSAQELRTGKEAGIIAGGRTALGEKLSIGQWFEIMSVMLDGEKAAESSFVIDFDVTDVKQKWRVIVNNGVLTTRLLRTSHQLRHAQERAADLSMELTRAELLDIFRGKKVDLETKGSIDVLEQLLDLVFVQQDSARGPSQL